MKTIKVNNPPRALAGLRADKSLVRGFAQAIQKMVFVAVGFK
jgi:hypothetical protein